MTRSTIFKNRIRGLARGLLVALFWLAVWELAYRVVSREIFLVSPARAVGRLAQLSKEAAFWVTIGLSCARVLTGFVAALVVGCALAVVSARFSLVRHLTAPLMGIVRATPVASFIILVLLWIATNRIPAFIAFLVVVPIVWGNLIAGLQSVDKELLEMAAVFRLSKGRILRTIYLPAELPHFASACSAGLGLAWKSAVAAEVISLPKMAIGRQLNNAKVYLETADLFAWTMAVILLSLVVEKLAIWMLNKLTRRLLGPAGGEEADRDAVDA